MASPKSSDGSAQSQPSVLDLVGVVYSAGKVFDGLSTGLLATIAFIQADDVSGIVSRPDLELLRDLKDMAKRVVELSGTQIDAEYVCGLNSVITRSGPLRPGKLRTQDQHIGVNTPLGRHEPTALTEHDLARLISAATSSDDVVENALELFVSLAKAQPFEDGNKRTALFTANGLLLSSNSGRILTIPMDDDNPKTAESFIDLLARAYLFDEHEGVKALMRKRGLASLPSDSLDSLQ